MSTEKLDAIIFGASGYTGQVAVEEAIKIFKDFKWGISGRNESKLKDVLEKVSQRTKQDLSHIPIILADVDDQKSIENMAKKCKIVVNCCGPYDLYGEVVVKACIDAGTHHVDISGEPQYFLGMQYKYDDLAREKGSYIISTCGFDSIPSDLGVLYAERNFEGTVNSVELYMESKRKLTDKSSKASINIGTWKSVMHATKYVREILALDKKLNSGKVPNLSPHLWMKPYSQQPAGLKGYFAPFPIIDRFVVRRSQYLFYARENKRPIQFEMYLGFRKMFLALIFPIMLLFLTLLGQIGFIRKLLIKYAHIVTGGAISDKGPLEVNRKSVEFRHTLKVKGWSKGTSESQAPNKEILVRVSGRDPGYCLTSTCMLLCAKVILQEKHKMPGSGGVLPPGYAFAKTQLIEELSRAEWGLKFEVVES
ncbi:saccharopine dehydrogenase-like oxidoreductase [Haematobia irritans]|uniref:saccharopine dehydrogenase-like oxidoreductase n=1 Tax=Haematobia irritans TaxID=7368 RepID=UPI003F4F5157